jgi:hypothetical protein
MIKPKVMFLRNSSLSWAIRWQNEVIQRKRFPLLRKLPWKKRKLPQQKRTMNVLTATGVVVGFANDNTRSTGID